MTEHLVLIFAYHFPPENAIGGARPARFAKYLAKLGYTVRVFTAAPHADSDFATTIPDPFSADSQRNLGWHFERAIRKTVLPSEPGIRWSRQAANAARAHLRENPAAKVTIFSTFPPLGAHFAAWQLARTGKFRWIADFRDPLAHEWKHTFLNPVQKRAYRRLEGALVQKADAVIANTDAAAAAWMAKYPSLADKVHLIWNGFDPDDRIGPLPIPQRDHKVLSHAGELYLGRTATPILKSVARLIDTGRLSAEKLRVRLVGHADPKCLPEPEFVRRAANQGWLQIRGEQIPQREARRVAQTSDGLLLLQPHSDVQVPGKLFEYIQIGRPIMAYIQPNSPTERILERSGVPYRAVYPDSGPEAVDELVTGFLDLSPEPVEPSAWFQQQFNAECQTQILDRLISSLHGQAQAKHGKKLRPVHVAGQIGLSLAPEVGRVTPSATCPSVRVTSHDIGDSVLQSGRPSA